MNQKELLNIIGKHEGDQGGLISVLEDVQSNCGYLPQEVLETIARETGRSLVDVFGVATFYRAFSLKPRGKRLVSVCLGTACHVRGSPAVADEVKSQLGIGTGETTADGEFTLEVVNCLGACALGPIVVAVGHYFLNVNKKKVKPILDRAREGFDQIKIKGDERVFPIEVSCPRCNHSLMSQNHPIDGYPSIRVTASFNRSHGWLMLSSLYGSYTVESEHEIPMDTVVNFFCPHCHAELVGASNCPDCSAPMVPMIVHGGGIGQICSRRGCRSHMLDMDNATIG